MNAPHSSNMFITDHPKVECKDTAAVLDETKVTLKCRVRANPPIENARYEFNDGEEKKKIKVGEIVDSIYMKKEDGVRIAQKRQGILVHFAHYLLVLKS